MYGLGVCATTDPSFPSGCASGYSALPTYYVPNPDPNVRSNAPIISSTPGAVQFTLNGCAPLVCQDASGKRQYDAQQQSDQITSMLPYLLGAGGVLIIAPGGWKLLSLPIAVLGVLQSYKGGW